MKNITLICLKTCGTCRGLEKVLKEKDISYQYREITEKPPSASELTEWKEKTKLPITRFLNSSGTKYRETGLAQKRQNMSVQELFDTIAQDGMLIKRPIVLEGDEVYIGPDAIEWAEQK